MSLNHEWTRIHTNRIKQLQHKPFPLEFCVFEIQYQSNPQSGDLKIVENLAALVIEGGKGGGYRLGPAFDVVVTEPAEN